MDRVLSIPKRIGKAIWNVVKTIGQVIWFILELFYWPFYKLWNLLD